MRPAFFSHPRPEGYAEGTVPTPAQSRAWVLSMDEDMQLEYFGFIGERVAEASQCFQMDHEGLIADLIRRVGALSESNRALRRESARL